MPTVTPVFTRPSSLGKRHAIVKVPCPIIYWVIEKNALVKVSPTHLHSAVSSTRIDYTNQSEIAAHWLPTVVTLTRMDPNQPEPLMRLPFSIEQDLLQFHPGVLIDFARTLNFMSYAFLTRNMLMGKCTHDPKIVVRIANE